MRLFGDTSGPAYFAQPLPQPAARARGDSDGRCSDLRRNRRGRRRTDRWPSFDEPPTNPKVRIPVGAGPTRVTGGGGPAASRRPGRPRRRWLVSARGENLKQPTRRPLASSRVSAVPRSARRLPSAATVTRRRIGERQSVNAARAGATVTRAAACHGDGAAPPSWGHRWPAKIVLPAGAEDRHATGNPQAAGGKRRGRRGCADPGVQGLRPQPVHFPPQPPSPPEDPGRRLRLDAGEAPAPARLGPDSDAGLEAVERPLGMAGPSLSSSSGHRVVLAISSRR